jgi:hypothetical protein
MARAILPTRMILATRLCPPYAVLFKLEFHLAAKPSHFSCSSGIDLRSRATRGGQTTQMRQLCS